MLKALLALFFGAFLLFAALACFFQLATGRLDGTISKNAEDDEAAHKRTSTNRRARLCAVTAGCCLAAALVCGVLLRMA